jgi:hypothetical protein
MSKAKELADAICRIDTLTEYQRELIAKAAAELRRRAALEQAAEPVESVDIVKFIGASDAQVNWGGGDDPRKYLSVGAQYVVKERDVHRMHTRIYLEDFPNKWFNSVCFADVKAKTGPAPRKPMTANEIWNADEIMSVNADAQISFVHIQRFVRAVERFHDIKE